MVARWNWFLGRGRVIWGYTTGVRIGNEEEGQKTGQAALASGRSGSTICTALSQVSRDLPKDMESMQGFKIE